MANIPIAFDMLVQKAKELLLSDPAADQVIAMQTGKGRIVRLANHGIAAGDTSDEVALIDALVQKGDTVILYGVCAWRNGALDVPSRHLNTSLILLNRANLEAEFLLYSTDGLTTKTLRAMR